MRERRKCGPFTRGWKGPYEWASKPAGSRSGSSGCWRSWDTGCGSETQGRFAPVASGSKRARCRTAAEASGGGSLSADLGAHGGRARRAAVAVASSQAGEHAHAGEEPVAGAGAESGCATEEEAVERSGKKTAGVVAATALGEPTESRVATAARSTGGVDRRSWTARWPNRPMRGRRRGD